MTSADPQALAQSMLKIYGPSKAFDLADRYALDCSNNGDNAGHIKWAEAAAIIARLTQPQNK